MTLTPRGDRYRAIDEAKPGLKGFGKNGQPFAYHLGPVVDSAGTLPDGRAFKDIREFKQLLLDREPQLARNLAKQLLIYATGAPVRFSDREALTGRVVSEPTPGDIEAHFNPNAIVEYYSR